MVWFFFFFNGYKLETNNILFNVPAAYLTGAQSFRCDFMTRWLDRTTEGSVQANPERAVAVFVYKDIAFNELLLRRVFNAGKGRTFTNKQR